MTDLPEIKYSIGQTVYRAGTVVEKRAHKCPDCLGSGKWQATSPAGHEYEVPCPRCRTSYRSNGVLSLEYVWHIPFVTRLTIGSVRLDTYCENEPVSYMCNETGIGSGQIHSQNDLFLTHAEAESAGVIKCAKINKDPEKWIAVRYNESLRYCDYQLDNALLENANKIRSETSAKAQMLFYCLENCETIEEVKERIKEEWDK